MTEEGSALVASSAEATKEEENLLWATHSGDRNTECEEVKTT